MEFLEKHVHWYYNEKPGWHEYRIDRTHPTSFEWLIHYNSIVNWILENIDMPHRHSRWVIQPEHALFRFRYERNYLLFVLRWS